MGPPWGRVGASHLECYGHLPVTSASGALMGIRLWPSWTHLGPSCPLLGLLGAPLELHRYLIGGNCIVITSVSHRLQLYRYLMGSSWVYHRYFIDGSGIVSSSVYHRYRISTSSTSHRWQWYLYRIGSLWVYHRWQLRRYRIGISLVSVHHRCRAGISGVYHRYLINCTLTDLISHHLTLKEKCQDT